MRTGDNPRLARGEVVLWTIRVGVPDRETEAPLWERLSEEERARANRFKFERDRTLYIAAHALLRIMLAAHGVPDARFRTNAWGKPELAAADNQLRFNLSHTRGLAACAITAIDDLGIDVEAVDPAIDVLDLARRYFAPDETQFLAGLPILHRVAAFYRLWTLKEAFIKAVGLGLSIPLDAFSFTLDPIIFTCAPILARVPDHWHFRSISLSDEQRLAVAVRSPDGGSTSIRHERIESFRSLPCQHFG